MAMKTGTLSDRKPTSLELVYSRPESDPVVDLLGRVIQKVETPVITKITNPKMVEKEKTHPIILIKDTTLEFPQLCLDVFLVGPPEDTFGFPLMFARGLCRQARNIDKADLVVFGGGPDLNPDLYGEEPHPETRWDDERDAEDNYVYDECLEKGIPMFGVCRGAQFLHVRNGGTLYQHVDNHHGPHKMWDTYNKMMLESVSSVHHQMVKPGTNMEIIGVCHESVEKWINPTEKVEKQTDIEAFFYRDTMCFGVQGHPEYSGYPFFTKWTLDMIGELIVYNPDIERTNELPYCRIKPDIVAQRCKDVPAKKKKGK